MTTSEKGAPQESDNDVDMTTETLYGASSGPRR